MKLTILMKNICTFIFVMILIGCSSQNTTIKKRMKRSKIEIATFLTVQENDSFNIKELRFNRVTSAGSTQRMMFKKFGKWDREIRPNNEKHPMLVWENLKLFESQNDLFSVAAYGSETYRKMYASIVVFDSKNKNCFNESYKTKDQLVEYFTKAMRNISSGKEFYKVYWEMVNAYEQ